MCAGEDLLESFCQLVGEGTELFVGELYVVVEVHVAFVLHGDEVDVCMRHLETEHRHAYLAAGAYLLDGTCDAVGKGEEVVVEGVVEVEDVVDLLFRDAEDVAAYNGIDVEECETVVGFGNFVAGNLAGYDFGKDGGHGNWKLKIKN